MNITDSDWFWTLQRWASKARQFARTRPLLVCHQCHGTGGAMSGYYEPEWSECQLCYQFWHELDDYSATTWFVGRMPVWAWLESRFAVLLGFDPRTPALNVMACYSDCHDWAPTFRDAWTPGDKPYLGQYEREYDGDFCRCCYTYRAPDGSFDQKWFGPPSEF